MNASPPAFHHLSLSPLEKFHFRHMGFTLVEMAMALGIFSFAIFPIIGMMGAAQNVSQVSIRASTNARILEQVTALISNVTTVSVSGTLSNTYYFNGIGQMTTLVGTGNLAPVYVASCNDSSSSLANFTQYPNNAAAGLISNKVTGINIQRYMLTTPSHAPTPTPTGITGSINSIHWIPAQPGSPPAGGTGDSENTFVLLSKDPRDQ